ncbi:flippase [Aliarcobacter cryaerophilus]|uniref:flippase n=1 Tax=Aliarcobacter cryaerophilus TaxID=28198 RepID=UPI0008304D7D|nr:flippase [Aliarcobacter cryaerophilus]
MKDILKGSAVIFAFKMFGAISLFFIHILISRYYGAEILGVFNLILSLMIIGAIISRFGLDMYIIRVIPSLEKEDEKISLFLKEVLKIVFVGSIAVSFLIYLLSDIINIYIFKSIDASYYIFGLIIVMVPFAFLNVLPEIFRGLHDIKIYSFFRNVFQNLLVLILLSYSIFLSSKFDPIYTLYSSIIIITGILFFVLYKFLKKHNIDLSIKGKYNDKILAYSYPMLLTSSMMFLMGYSDVFMISYYLDEYQVGIYSACVKLSFAVIFILASINGFIAPKISQAYSNGEKHKINAIYKSSIKLILLFTTPIFILLYIFPEFFLGLFGSEFLTATTTLIIINTAFLINAIFGSVGYILNMTDNQKFVSKVIFICLLLNMIFNLILIPLYGIDGAAIATVISTLIMNLSLFFKLKKIRMIYA